jgi:chromosome partitioning protein
VSTPVLTFFNTKAGVGKTSLVYHLAWMLSEMGTGIVAMDLDPQANLTSGFLPGDELEKLWDIDAPPNAATIFQSGLPLFVAGVVAMKR